jgi:hypothetical protein
MGYSFGSFLGLGDRKNSADFPVSFFVRPKAGRFFVPAAVDERAARNALDGREHGARLGGPGRRRHGGAVLADG